MGLLKKKRSIPQFKRIHTGLKAGAVGFGRKAEAFGLRRNPTLFALALEVAWDDVGDTGAPVAAGVGVARKPPLFMKAGDVCEVEVDGLGILRNPIADEQG